MTKKVLAFPDEYNWVEGFIIPESKISILQCDLENIDDYMDQKIIYWGDNVIVTLDDVEVENGMWEERTYIYTEIELKEI